MKKAKALVLIMSIFLGVNSINTSFAYWNNADKVSTGVQGNINIGSFPSKNNNIDEGRYSFKRGEHFLFNNVEYCVLKNIENIYISESVLKGEYNFINLADGDNFNAVNYYDEWSKPIYFGSKTEKAQPIVSYSTGSSPDSYDSSTKYIYNVLSQNMKFVHGFPYKAVGMVVRDPFDGAFYYNTTKYIGSSNPSQTQNWGSSAPWKKIATYSVEAEYSVGDYVYWKETNSVYVVCVKQEKNPKHAGPSHAPKEFRPYNIATYITVGGEKKIVSNFNVHYTYNKGEFVLTGYDSANRAIIYTLEAETATTHPSTSPFSYVEVLDPFIKGSTASLN